MRRISNLIYLFLFISLLLFVASAHKIHAQIITNQSGKTYSVNQEVPISAGSNFAFQLVGLEKNKKYRIEIGSSGKDDQHLQYNIFWNNTACNPADFGSSEQNKEADEITVTSCIEDTNIPNLPRIIFAGILSTGHIGINPGNKYTFKLKHNESGSSNQDFVIILSAQDSPKINVTPSSTTAGTNVKATINKLIPDQQYRAFLTLEDGNERYSTPINLSNNCSDGVKSGKFILTSCILEGGTYKAVIDINTTGFNCSPLNNRDNTGVRTCKINLINPDGVTVTSGDLKISPNPISLEVLPQEGNTQIYEKTPLKLNVKGCPSGTTNIDVVHTSENASPERISDENFKQLALNNNNDLETISLDTSGTKTDSFFGEDYKNKLVKAIAICRTNNLTSNVVNFTVSQYGSGNEKMIIDPSNIAVGEPASINLTNLSDKCYSIRIKNIDGDFIGNNQVEANSGGCEEKMENKPFALAFKTSNREANHKLDLDFADGIYVFMLYKDRREAGLIRSITGDTLGFIISGSLTGNIDSTLFGGKIEKSIEDAIKDEKDDIIATATLCVGIGGGTSDTGCTGITGSNLIPCFYGYTKDQVDDTGKIKEGSVPVDLTKLTSDDERKEAQKNLVRCAGTPSPFGILSTEPGQLVATIFRVFLSISGGIVLLLIIRSGYQLLFSQGNPEQIKEARERLTSAFIGFLFLIFSLVILETIGVDILHIPGFGS